MLEKPKKKVSETATPSTGRFAVQSLVQPTVQPSNEISNETDTAVSGLHIRKF